MKKTKSILIICLVSIFLVVSVWLCVDLYVIPGDWQEIDIDGFGTIKVPGEWNCSVKNGFMYFSVDQNDVLVQYIGPDKANDYFHEVVEYDSKGGINFSNSASLHKKDFMYADGQTKQMYVLRLTGQNYDTMMFYCVDSSVSASVLRKIANSYEMY